MKIHTIEITTRSGSVLRFYVRHNSSAQARSWLLENHVTASVSSQDDVIAMVRDGIEPIGPSEVTP